MKSTIAVMLLIMASAGHSQTVSRENEPAAIGDRDAVERLLREWQIENDSPWRRQILERHMADERRQEFVTRANRFVAIWNKLMDEYKRSGSFNVKDARELSKAFRDLQATGWPK